MPHTPMPTGRMRGRAHDQPHDSGHALRVPDANRNACAEYGSGGGVVTGDIPSGQIREPSTNRRSPNSCRPTAAASTASTDLIRSVFHPGAIADYGTMFTGTGHEFADFIGQVHPPMSAHSHLIGSISITVSGDIAGSASRMSLRDCDSPPTRWRPTPSPRVATLMSGSASTVSGGSAPPLPAPSTRPVSWSVR